MAGKERRKHSRIDAKIKVAFQNKDEFFEEYTRNISQGGIFLKTDKLLDPNAVLEIDLRLPGAAKEMTVIGRVRRLMVVSDPEREGEHLYGVGIEFIDSGEEFNKAIKNFIKKEHAKE